jgi:hypothetical protein
MFPGLEGKPTDDTLKGVKDCLEVHEAVHWAQNLECAKPGKIGPTKLWSFLQEGEAAYHASSCFSKIECGDPPGNEKNCKWFKKMLLEQQCKNAIHYLGISPPPWCPSND